MSISSFLEACYDPPGFDYAVIDVSTGMLFKNAITFKCMQGYLLEGDPTIVCQANGHWSKRKFTCRGMRHRLKTSFLRSFRDIISLLYMLKSILLSFNENVIASY